MHIKNLVSPLALAAGLLITGAASAQTWVGDQEVSDADLATVQDYCDELQAAENVAGDISTGPEETDSDDSDVGTPMADAGVNLDLITIEDCRAAGLIL